LTSRKRSPLAPMAFGKLIGTELAKWGKVFRNAGMQPE
jgi:hypothetical protein